MFNRDSKRNFIGFPWKTEIHTEYFMLLLVPIISFYGRFEKDIFVSITILTIKEKIYFIEWFPYV